MSIEQVIATARQQWLSDQHDASLQSFRQACAQQPHDVRLAIECASYLGMRFEIVEAVELLAACETQVGSNPQALYQIGLAYLRSYRPDHALRCFQLGISAGPYERPLLAIVEFHERRGRIREAWEALDRCLIDSPDAQLWKARLLIREQQHDEAQRILKRLVESDSTGASARVTAWYLRAEAYDEQDEVKEAVSAARAAKALQADAVKSQLGVASSLAPIEANFVRSVTRDHFARWQESEVHPPVALLTGPPRSGTSLICRMFGMHPRLCVADEIEAYSTYLQPKMLAGKSGTSGAEVLDSLSSEAVEAHRKLYRRWLSAALDQDVSQAVLLDKMPSTTFLVSPFRRLHPNAVIIMAIRDPRDVVVSCFLRQFELNPVSAMFSRLDLTVMRLRAEWMAWLELREKLTLPWVEVRYEPIVAGDYSNLRRAFQLLGLEWDDEFAQIHKATSHVPVRSPTYAQLRQPITQRRVGRWTRYRQFLEPQLTSLDEIARRLGYS